MAIFRGSKIRGEQIQDGSIKGANILQKTLANEHLADNASIAESKLNIDWHSHKEALQDKKLVDFVQANGIKAKGTSVLDLETQVPTLVGTPKALSADNVEGIITDSPKNLVPFRDSVTGEPLVATINSIEYEVIARMEYDDTNKKYIIKFYTASGTNGAEEAYDIGSTEVVIDIQYAQRFNLDTVGEMFAANEKFVHGAADVTAYLNIEQVAKDVYGAGWSLDRDGVNNLTTSIADQIANEKTRAQAAEATLTTAVTDETANRTTAVANLQSLIDVVNGNDTVTGSVDYKIKTKVIDPLASTVVGKGASLVGISTIAGMTATNVQDAIAELKTSAGDALVAFKADLSSTADGKGATLIAVEASAGFKAATVEGVLKDHETRLGAAEVTVAATEQEVKTARGSKTSLNERLSVSMRADGFLVDDAKIHVHKKYTITLTAATSQVSLPAGEFFNINNPTGNGVVLKDSVQVYINGILQSNGINFTEVADAGDAKKGVGIDFGTEQLIAGDVVVFEYVLNNAN